MSEKNVSRRGFIKKGTLGIKDIRLGLTLPAFITPNGLNVRVDKFNIMPTATPDQDLKAIFG